MTITTARANDRLVSCWNAGDMHVLGFTTVHSRVHRFLEIHVKPGPAPNVYLLTRFVEAWHPPVTVTTGVQAQLLKLMPTTNMLAALSMQGEPVMRPINLHALVGRHRDLGFRSRRDLFAHVEQAQLAEYYDALMRAGIRTPLNVIANEQYAGRKSDAANRLAQARANGYLTSAGPGVAGGTVTEKALALLGRVGEATESGTGTADSPA